MNKLGFAIKLASQGAGNAIECNKGQWTSKVVDIREYLKLFNGLQSTDNIVTFMSFDESGCFLTQLRAISGRVGDFLSGWIYIPNSIEATGEDIMNAYNYVRNILSKSNLNDSLDDIDSFFSKEYPSKEIVAQYIPSKGPLFGVRFIGHYSLKEIVGEHRYQPYYSDYKAIFLLNKEDEVSITKEAANSFRNLSDADIVKTAILLPPTKASLQTLGRGTKIYTSDGKDFTDPLLVNVGSKVPLLFSRVGFENMKWEYPVTSERQEVDLSNLKVTWCKKISSSMFIVKNHKNEQVKGATIFVNNDDISYHEVLLSEDDCRNAMIKVSVPEYEIFEERRNLLNEDFNIRLSRRIKSTQTFIELSNGSYAEMTLESKDLTPYSDSPLKGYAYEDNYQGNQVLRLSTWFVWKQRLCGFFGGLCAILIIVAFFAFDAWLDTHHFKIGLPPWEEDHPAQSYQQDGTNENGESDTENNDSTSNVLKLEDAIKYLDENPVWTKSEMERYPDLVGLFDDMNNFNLSKIINDWSSKLSNSNNFMRISKSASRSYNNFWEPKQGNHNPTYNQHGDERINITNYSNWLDKDQTPATTASSNGFHPTHGASGHSNVSSQRNGNPNENNANKNAGL